MAGRRVRRGSASMTVHRLPSVLLLGVSRVCERRDWCVCVSVCVHPPHLRLCRRLQVQPVLYETKLSTPVSVSPTVAAHTSKVHGWDSSLADSHSPCLPLRLPTSTARTLTSRRAAAHWSFRRRSRGAVCRATSCTLWSSTTATACGRGTTPRMCCGRPEAAHSGTTSTTIMSKR